MKSFALKLSFYRKQMLLGILTTIASLMILSVAVYKVFFEEYKRNLIESAVSKNAIVSTSLASSIVFSDSDAADSILLSLSELKDFRYAQLYHANGELFVESKKDESISVQAFKDLKVGVNELGKELLVNREIFLDKELVGYSVLSTGVDGFQEQVARLQWYLLIAIIFTTMFAFVISLRTQKYMSKPILALVDLANYVVNRNKYDRRVDIHRSDEIGNLMGAVNQMLDKIERQNKSADRHAEELESLVELRTKQLFERANYDSLTRLPNRHLLVEYLEKSIELSKDNGKRVAVLFLDLNRFKIINDSLGHAIGDQLLKIVGYKLCYALKKVDCVSRWGGDEFVIVLRDVESDQQVEALCERIIKTVSEPCLVEEHQFHVSTSIGVAIYPDHGENSSDLLKNADSSMYVAKNTGIANYCFFNMTMLSESVTRLSMEANVRSALESESFSLVYQPIFNIDGTKLTCVEALSRWEHNGEFVSPAVFIPIIEELGLMFTFTQGVVQKACQQVQAWNEEGRQAIPIAINLPASVLILPSCMDMIISTIDEAGIDPKYIQVEITESSFVDSTDLVHVNLLTLRGKGISVALDDFGTGYSCLSYLKDLPITKLKIDGSFVSKIGEDKVSSGVVLAIIMMAKTIGVELVAECVESEAQLEFLKAHKVDYIQGYLFSKPLSDAELDKLKSRLETSESSRVV